MWTSKQHYLRRRNRARKHYFTHGGEDRAKLCSPDWALWFACHIPLLPLRAETSDPIVRGYFRPTIRPAVSIFTFGSIFSRCTTPWSNILLVWYDVNRSYGVIAGFAAPHLLTYTGLPGHTSLRRRTYIKQISLDR